MRICLIAEGSYPYVTGGVSSWIQTLITSMPEHEFVIYAIGAHEKNRGKFKYKLPENLTEVREVFLDSYLSEEGVAGKQYFLTQEQKEVIKSLLDHQKTDWNQLFALFRNRKIDSVSNFIMSRDLYDIIQELCIERYPQIPFTELFWSVRAMLLPLFWLLKNPVPEADIYHSASTGYAGVVAGLGKYMHDKPYVLTEHGIYTREREEEIIKSDWIKGYFKDLWIQYFYSLSQCAYAGSDQIISLFNKNKEIQVEIGCQEEKVRVIPNGVNPNDFNGLAPKRQDEQGYINVGAVVRVVPIKDIKTMIQSFAIVKKQVSEARFYIFGPYEEDPEYYEECLQLLESLGTEDIYFTGTVNIKEYIGGMDILILSSISEGQPLAILEGMASGKPFVSTDVGSCSELIYGLEDGIGPAGIIVPVMNYVKMAEAIVQLAGDPELRSKMGGNGRKRVADVYTKESFIERYKQIYKNTRVLKWQELVSN
ncbi:GT4 family glycosyltransferase PelF [Bacillus paramycoides]|uniref:GT4 family glycosyltransferase PelF n=1 Tax=Bacillus paramycoides TaxID=2026194 RepID=A0ABU6N410_9BACI|nr:GT4 family glycosyltransferase PelF [Bacillus paramycoides]MED1568638.1 GT4 family glycosyltransferase PelF [Bacillus paramycoides]